MIKATVKSIRLKLAFFLFCAIVQLAVITVFISYDISINSSLANSSRKRYTDSFNNSMQPLRASHSQTCQSAVSNSSHNDDVMHFAIASCDVSVHTVGVALIKSFVIFSKPDDVVVLHVFVSTDSEATVIGDLLEQTFERPAINSTLCYALYAATFPSHVWANLFRPCAAQRLFLPELLPNVSRIAYLDTDTVFLRPVADVWSQFNRFNDKHIGGLTRESEEAKQSGYDTFATLDKCPFPAPAGLNSAVFLMHLDRMRQINWTDSLTWILNNYATCINLGDQDILNIFFYFHNTSFYTLPCSFNYRIDHCVWNCLNASQHGVAILHANRQMLLRDVKHPHRSIFDIISRFGVEDFNPSNSADDLLNLLLNAVWTNPGHGCRHSNIFTRGLLTL